MRTDSVKANVETAQQRFERVLTQSQFQGLKTIMDCLASDREMLHTIVLGENTYRDLLARLGYQLTIIRQIHVQDCYARVGPKGGIKDVFPYYDIPTQGSMPTVVNLDASVTTTPKSAAFFEALFLEFKRQLRPQS
jgi:hypothetical protein